MISHQQHHHQVQVEVNMGAPSRWKKYANYAVVVDPDQDDRANEIKLYNFSRPHMRAFHCSVSSSTSSRLFLDNVQVRNWSNALVHSLHGVATLNLQWWGFFVAFFIWFAIVPLLSEIRDDLGITKRDIWNSTIVNFGAVMFIRLLLGPLCDR